MVALGSLLQIDSSFAPQVSPPEASQANTCYSMQDVHAERLMFSDSEGAVAVPEQHVEAFVICFL